MRPSDRLDAQLSARLADGSARDLAAPASTAETLPQLMAADVLSQWRSATPRTDYADVLESQLLDHATSVAARGAVQTPARAPGRETMVRRGNVSPLEPATDSRRLGGGNQGSILPGRTSSRDSSRFRPFRSLVAAALLLLVLGAGMFTAAAQAGPGSPLYGLRRFEQDVRVRMTSSPSDRIRLRLDYAKSDLAVLDKALARQTKGSAYSDALASFQSDIHAIWTDLPALGKGAESDTLAAQVTALEAQGRSDLLHGLHMLSWTDRVKTTEVLGSLGVPIPAVTMVTITRTHGPSSHITQILIVGSNFQQGVVAEINGVEVGAVLSQSTSQLVIQVEPTFPVTSAKTVGVSNPDGTSAETADIAVVLDAGNGKGSGSGGEATPGPAATVTNGNGNGGGHPGGGSHGTPTPSR